MTAPIEVAGGVWVTLTTADRATASTHHDDRRRAAALPEWRAREFLAGRGLLRQLLAAVAPGPAGAEIVPDRRGKPWLHGHPDLGISVSHSRGTLAAGVALGRAVGVDVQRPDPAVRASFARRLLGTHAGRLTALPPAVAAEEVAWVWTAQEACVKAAGPGLAGRPWTIDVPPGARSGRWRGYRWRSLRDHSSTPLSCAFALIADAPDPPTVLPGTPARTSRPTLWKGAR
ncbi:4'-phosphopantetheinyl transferase family protein [Streptomyces sp. NRRL S-1448]|uniref:4'-phosphopantetheinyl transferase family protein n=1 Tax=Streptomyces sp. NRRL S-1448 TaxID=1463883 RepID=UPI0007C478ED|nr:4'-phosphopantetheinyl transferase superfamily protein [Streptomyces sp. NRRL S-1448]